MRNANSSELSDLQKEMAGLRSQLRSLGTALLQCEGRLAAYLQKHGRRRRRLNVGLLVKEIISKSERGGSTSREIYDRLIETSEFIAYGSFRTFLSRMKRRGEIVGRGSSRPIRWTIPLAKASEPTGEGE